MHTFKSGIIFKNRMVIAEGENDSYKTLTESLGLELETEESTRKRHFVMAKLVPQEDMWWINPEEHPESWSFVVDQDITPDWFKQAVYEKDFRESVCAWWKAHVLVDQKLGELTGGYYQLKRSEVKRLCNDVKVFLDSSRVGEMWDSSRVGEMRVDSQVGEMWDSSRVGEMWDGSQVGEMWDGSQVGEMWDGSQVGEMRDGSQVGKMRDRSQVDEMWNSSRVGEMRDGSQVDKMFDRSQVDKMRDNSRVGEMRNHSQVGEMWNHSQVGEMWDNSTAGDFKEYPKIKIMIPSESFDRFEMVAFENKTERE